MWSYEKIKNYIEVVSNSGCLLFTQKIDYKNMKQNIIIQCKCGINFTTSFQSFKNNKKQYCEECRKNILRDKYSYTYEYVKNYIEQEGYILLSEAYINCKIPLKIKCPKGHIFDVIFDSFKNQGTRCKICAGLMKKTTEEFIEDLKIYHSNNINVLSEYISAKDHIKLECNICHKKWRATPDSLLRGNGCPHCRQSKGEKRIAKYFKEHDIVYKYNYKFDNCIYKKRLPFDFAIFHNNLLVCLIEYDGKQHYESIDFYGGNKNYQIQKIRDQIKTDYCKNNNINLIRIPYWDFDNIENILEEKLVI